MRKGASSTRAFAQIHRKENFKACLLKLVDGYAQKEGLKYGCKEHREPFQDAFQKVYPIDIPKLGTTGVLKIRVALKKV